MGNILVQSTSNFISGSLEKPIGGGWSNKCEKASKIKTSAVLKGILTWNHSTPCMKQYHAHNDILDVNGFVLFSKIQNKGSQVRTNER